VIGLARFPRVLLGCALLFLAGVAQASELTPELVRGFDWLSAQVQSDGTLANENASIATETQVRTETLHTLAMAGRLPPALLDAVRSEDGVATESLARRMISLAASGADVSGMSARLSANVERDSGFGAEAGYPANALDTAFALGALGVTHPAPAESIAQGLGYLANASSDGRFGEGQAAYATAYALLAMHRWSSAYDLRAAITRSRDALSAMQVDGRYDDSMQNAVATLALTEIGSEELAAGALVALRDSQAANGSWDNDPYVTALALKALTAVGTPPSQGVAKLVGEVLDSGTNQPLAGVTAELMGSGSSALTGFYGRFAINGASTGEHTLLIRRNGYQSIQRPITLSSGVTHDAGRISLSVLNGSAVLRGVVMNTHTNTAEPGVMLSVQGAVTTQTETDEFGRYEVAGLPAGEFNVSTSKAGFTGSSEAISLSPQQVGWYTASVYPDGEQPPLASTASIKGQVIESSDGSPIEGASISSGSISTASGPDGQFELAGLPIDAFEMEVRSAAHLTVTLGGRLAPGLNDVGSIAMLSGPGGEAPTATTIAGRVTDVHSGVGISDARVLVDGVERARTGGDGAYRVEGITPLSFVVGFRAAGYASRELPLQLSAPSEHRLDQALEPSPAAEFQVLGLDADARTVRPFDTMRLTAQISLNGNADQEALALLQIKDASGVVRARACGTVSGAADECSYVFRAGSTVDWSLERAADNLPAGTYRLTLNIVEPGTISQSNPTGEVLSHASTDVEILAVPRLSGTVNPNPPALIPQSPSGVRLLAMIINNGNASIPTGELLLKVRSSVDAAVVHSATINNPEIAIGAIAELDFGVWHPATAAEYTLEVEAPDGRAEGVASGELYVGDSAAAVFTATPNSVPDGDQTVRGRIDISAIDNPMVESADPLFSLVKQAVDRGASYTLTHTKAWQGLNGCDGCHVQSQALYGLTHIKDTAGIDIDGDSLRYFANVTTSSVQANGSVDVHHPSSAVAQTALALWGLSQYESQGVLPDRYRMAQFLLNRQVDGTAGRYWPWDYRVGWYASTAASTAVATEGLAALHRDVSESQSATYADYSARVAVPAYRSSTHVAANDETIYSLTGMELLATPTSGGEPSVVASFPYSGNIVDMAVAPNGDVYWITSIPHLMRWRPGSAAPEYVRMHLPFTPGAIAIGSDGTVKLATVDRRLLTLDDQGHERDIVPSAALPAFTDIVALADGTIVGVYGAHNGLTFVRPNGVVEQVDSGMPVRASALAVAQNDGFYVYGTTWGGWPALVHLDRNLEAHRVNVVPNMLRIGSNGTHLYIVDNTFVIHEVAHVESTYNLDRIADAIRATVPFQLSQPINSSYNGDLAFNLVGLAEALPFVNSESVRQEVEARILAIGQVLRARQLSDGSWRFVEASWIGQDVLTTAVVGTALEYLNPGVDDPVLRSSVEYILKNQASDGSWHVQYYFPTSLATTSYIMAYLPKVYSRLSGLDVELELQFSSDVSMSNPTVSPDDEESTPAGGSKVVFDLGRVTSDLTSLEFDLELSGLLPAELRLVAGSALLRFRNSFNGEIIELPIEVPTVRVQSGYALELALNRDEFQANEVVDVLPTVRNLGAHSDAGQLRYFIEMSDGSLVIELPATTFQGLIAGSDRIVPQEWNTATTQAGEYRARVLLFSENGVLLDEAQLPFRILAGPDGQHLLSGRVATDEAEYGPFEAVTILGRVTNASPNSSFDELTLNEVVTTPDGDVLFSGNSEIVQLLPSALFDHSFSFELAAAAPGVYHVLQTVTDNQGQVLDTREASFIVSSTADTGVGLTGTIVATPDTVEQGLPATLDASATNTGNADLLDVPLTLSVVDLEQETVLWSQESVHDLLRASPINLQSAWISADVEPGVYVAVLSAEVAGSVITLAHSTVTVVEPPVQATLSLSVSTDNRLLVLLSCPVGNGRADDQACVAARATFLDGLLTDMGISHAVVTTTDAFTREFRSGRYNTYWISGGAQKLANPLAEEVREAVFRGDGLLVDGSHDSRNRILNDALGVRHIGQLPGNAHRMLSSGDTFGETDIAVPGDALRYDLTNAVAHGTFDVASGLPALAVNEFGRGGAVVHAYDLVRALQEHDSAAAARVLLDRSLREMIGADRSGFVAGEYVEVSAWVNNLAREAELALELSTEDALTIVDANPDAEHADHFVEWVFEIGEAAQRWFDAGIRLSSASGSFRIDAEVQHRANGTVRSLDTASTQLVVRDRAELVGSLLSDLRQLSFRSAAERNARDRVVRLIEQADTELGNGRHDDAIGTLLRAIDELTKLSSVGTAPYRIGIGELMGIVERDWVPTQRQ